MGRKSMHQLNTPMQAKQLHNYIIVVQLHYNIAVSGYLAHV